MLIQFSVSNYLSFKEQATLSMAATALREPSSLNEEVLFHLEGTDISVVESSVILGANASGKSNLVKALDFFKKFVTGSFKSLQAGDDIGVDSFRLNNATVSSPSSFEIIFSQDDFIYRYGFEATRKSVTEEWLYRKGCKKRAKEVCMFYREQSGTTVHPKYGQAQELVNKNMVRDNALLLSTAAQFNDPLAVSVIKWLGDMDVIFCSDEDAIWENSVRHLDDKGMKERIVDFSKYADLGIDDIEKVNDRLVSTHTQYDDDGNKTDDITFSFMRNESDGTLKYFSLSYPILHALDTGGRLVIDEFDSKLHPLLTEHIISLFGNSETNPRHAQLVFTTHDSNLLSSHLFRRDQIWFTQKDRYGATELYSLAEYKVRSNSPFEKDYLAGKYGATPIIGNIELILNGKGNGTED